MIVDVVRDVVAKTPRSVNLSAKTEYACIAVLELAARRQVGEPVRIREIAERQGVPPRFLVQILLQLKSAGVVVSTRGAAGGYQLARKPEDVTLGEVMAVMEGPAAEAKTGASVSTPITRVLGAAWRRVDDAQRRMLDEITFADLVEEMRGQADSMYYI